MTQMPRMVRMPRPPGMTLVELMVAIALVVVMSGGVVTLLWNLQRARDATQDLARSQASLDAWMESIEADLFGAAVSVAGAPGVSGGGEELSVVSRRIGVGPGAATPAQRLADARRSTHRLENGRIVVVSGGVGAEGVRRDAASGVRALRFRFLTDQGWQASFDSRDARTLPLAVEVGVWLGPRAEPEPGAEDQPESPAEGPPDRLRIIAVPDAVGGEP